MLTGREAYRRARVIMDLPFVVFGRGEILFDHARREPHECAFAIGSFGSRSQHVGIDVRPDDSRFRTRRRAASSRATTLRSSTAPRRSSTAPTKYESNCPARFLLDPLRQQIRGETFELMLFAIEVRLVDREGIDDLLDLFLRIRPQPARSSAVNDAEFVALMRSTTRRCT